MNAQTGGQSGDRSKPKYSVATAARMTAVSPATLRAWEKRYGVPAPSRTPSRYRLYSDDDLTEIQWMKARVEDGIPPRQAARLAAERREAGLPLQGAESLEAPMLVADLKTACLAFNEDGAQQVLRRSAGIMRPTEITRSVLLPTVAAIGRDWEAGLATVAQEHFASQMARRYAGRLMDIYQPATGFRPILCACAPGEQHELGLLAVAIEMRSRGFPVIYLGPDVPVEALVSSAESVRAGVIVVSVTLPEHLAAVAAVKPLVMQIERTIDALVIWAGPAAERAPDHGLPGRIVATIDQAVVEISSAARRPRFTVSEN